MSTIRRAALIACLALAACATTSQPRPGEPIKATGVVSAFEGKTLYSCTAASGSQLVFSRPRLFVSAIIRTGTAWLRPRSLADGVGVTPTSPIPSSGSVADGWVRLTDGQVVTWGIDNPDATTGPASQGLAASQFVNAIDVWCEAQGDVVVNAR